MGTKRKTLTDTCVVYFSKADGCWVGHSLRTDQVGTGDCVLEALADLLKAVKGLLELKAEDPDIEVLRRAPDKIRRMAEKAEPLPRELYEIAHKMVQGDWPGDIPVDVTPPHRRSFKANMRESVMA